MAKSDRLFEMLRLVAAEPGKWKAANLATVLSVSERAIYRYLRTIKDADIDIVLKGQNVGYTLLTDYWVYFLTKHRKNRGRQKESLIELLRIAYAATRNRRLRKQAKEFLTLLEMDDIG